MGTVSADAVQTGSWMTAADLKRLERQSLTAALEHAGWRVSGPEGAVELIGIKPNTLRYRVKVLGIRKPKSRRS